MPEARPSSLRSQRFPQFFSFLQRLWGRLVDPPDSIKNPGDWHRARLLSSLLVVLLAFALVGGLWAIGLEPEIAPVIGVIIIIFGAAYMLSRSRFRHLAAILTIAILALWPHLLLHASGVYEGRRIFDTLVWSFLALWYSALLFNYRVTAGILAVNLLGVILLPLLVPQVHIPTLLYVALYMVTAASLALTGENHWSSIEKDHTRVLLESNQQLQENERFVRTVLDSLSAQIVVLDKNGTILSVNNTWQDFAQRSGLTPNAITPVGRNYRELLTRALQMGDSRALQMADGIASVLNDSEEEFYLKYSAHLHDGANWFEMTVLPLTHPVGGVVVAHEDITARMRVEEERVRLYVAERDARQYSETLQAANLALTRTLDLKTVLETLLDYLAEIVPYDSANVMLLQDGHLLTSHTLRGYEAYTDPVLPQNLVFDVRSIEHIRSIIDNQTSLIISNTLNSPSWSVVEGTQHIRSWMAIPLVAGGKTIGLYSVDKVVPDFFTEEHKERAEALTAQAAIAIQNARLVEEVRQYTAELEERIAEKEKIEADLQSERDFLRLVTETMGQGLTVTDRATRFRLINPAMAEMVGLKPEDMIDIKVRDIVLAEDHPILEEQVELRRSGAISSYELRLKHKEGHTVPVLVSATPLNVTGSNSESIAVVTNLTERKRAEDSLRQEREFARALLENLTEGVVACDKNGRLTIFNRTAREWHGMDALALPPEQWADYYDLYEEDGKSLMATESIPLLRAFHGEAVREVGMAIQAKDQKLRHILASGNAFFDSNGQKLGAVVAMHDITERKQAEDALLQREAILEAVAFAGERFLAGEGWAQEMDAILARFGQATGVSRIVVFQNRQGEGEDTFINAIFEWCIPGIPRLIDQPGLKDFDMQEVGLGKFEELLSQGKIVQNSIEDFPEEVSELLAPFGLNSIVNVPVFVNDHWWGGISFIQSQGVRQWTTTELDAIKVAVSTFAAAIESEQAAEALRESEERFRQLADNIKGVFWMTDVWKLTMLYISRGYRELWGRSRQSLYDNPLEWMAAILPEDRAIAEAAFARQRQGETTDVEYRIVRPDGSIRWIHDRAFPVSDQQGKLIRVAGIAEDVTERVQVQEQMKASEARFRGLFETAPDGNILVDPSGKIVLANPQASVMFGYASDEILGMPVDSLVPPRYTGHADLRAAYTTNPRTRVMGNGLELSALHRDGSEFPVEVLLNPVDSSDGGLVMATIRDVTERKQAEAETIARQAAEKASMAKSEFLSRMSHELRTPMNSILGFGQLLERGRKDTLTPGQLARVQQILKAGRHLLALINEILEISRIEAGRMPVSPEPVDVVQAALEVIELSSPLAEERQIEIHTDIDSSGSAYAIADLQRLKQVLLNLLSNAIKYSGSRNHVWLSIERRHDGWWRISVRDTGPGIPEDQLNRLFQPFERLGAEQKNIEGTGLGLSLSQRLVELMGGQIGVESVPGKGSTFWVALPPTEHPAKERLHVPDIVSSPRLSAKEYTLLYIEDNSANYELVQQVLSDETKIELLWAMAGQEGIELARQRQPDLVLLDLDLPDMQGDEVLTRLRQIRSTQSIPIVILSADATASQLQRLMTAGADAYLTKPLNVEAFLQTVSSLIEES